jgi:hypothetical protein
MFSELLKVKKGKVVPAKTLKAHTSVQVEFYSFWNRGTEGRWVARFTSQKVCPRKGTGMQKSGDCWTAVSGKKFQGREKFHASAGFGLHVFHQTLTTLPQTYANIYN